MCRAPELFGLLLLEHISSLEVHAEYRVRAFSEPSKWSNVKHRKNGRSSARPAKGRPPFVFLQLLERNAERDGKRRLAQARFQRPQAQPRSNVAINDVRRRSDINSTDWPEKPGEQFATKKAPRGEAGPSRH